MTKSLLARRARTIEYLESTQGAQHLSAYFNQVLGDAVALLRMMDDNGNISMPLTLDTAPILTKLEEMQRGMGLWFRINEEKSRSKQEETWMDGTTLAEEGEWLAHFIRVYSNHIPKAADAHRIKAIARKLTGHE